MKKTILLISLFSFCLKIIDAQSGNLDPLFGTRGIVKTNAGSNYNYELIGKQALLDKEGGIYTLLQSGGQTFIGKKHPDGTTDSTYGNDGFSTSMALVPFNAAFQPDGKIVVAGSIFNGVNEEYLIVRYNADGSPDKSFNIAGTQSIDFPVAAITVQSDGKIVAIGSVTNNGNSYFALARYNANGGLDLSFSEDGKQTTDFGFSKPSDKGGDYPENDLGYAAAIQNDGKIVVAGSAFNYTASSRELAIARYNIDGSLDNSFNSTGKQVANFGASENYGYSVAFQNDQKIVVGGYANLDGYSYDLAIVRYNTDGSLDITFDGDGKQTTRLGSVYHNANTVTIQNDDKIVLQGDSWNGESADFSTVRYNTNGSLDNTFNGNGKKITNFGSNDDNPNSVIIQSDGKIIETGSSFNGTNYELAIVRYKTDGSFDNTFNKNGKLVEGLNRGSTSYTSSAVQQDGKIIAAGYTWNGNNYDFIISRYNVDGIPDSSFSNDGKQITGFASGNDFANDVSIQSDGKIVVGGYTDNGSTSYFALARYNTDGSLDKTFSSDGKQTTNFGFYAELGNSVAIQNDGKIIIAGSVFTGSNYDAVDFAVARYNTDGRLDNTFGKNGKQLTDLDSSDDFGSSVIIQDDGKILIAGRTWNGIKNNVALVRYNADGTLDNAFGNNGKQVSDFGPADYFGEAAALQPDGKIIVAGYTQIANVGSSFALARYTTDGKLDTTFNKTGLRTKDFGGGFEVATSVAIQNNGKIIVAGGTNGDFTIARYNINGSTDTAFGTNGIRITKASGGDDRIQAITIRNDKLYATGYGSFPATLGVVAKYLLNDSTAPPTVSLTAPANNATYLAPAAHIKLSAVASDVDGTISKVEFYNGSTLLHTETVAPYGYVWKNVSLGKYILTAKATDNNGLVTTSAAVHISVVPNKAPAVNIIRPANNQTYPGPATIHLEAAAKDPDGRITKVEFYNGSTLLRTELKLPYTFAWKNVPVGNYSITAKATDNWGAVTTSAVVNISVHSNLAPAVIITGPVNGEGFTSPATIPLRASAVDPDGRITKVAFYNGTALLRTERKLPYSYNWQNVTVGTYTITAVAIDNYGAKTTSAPIIITVKAASAMMVSNKPFAEMDKMALNNALQLKVYPTPATNVVNLSTNGLLQNKQTAISVISASGVVVKTILLGSLSRRVQLNVSSLAKGVYTIKLQSGDKVVYKQFLKL